jgi:hypothetical protein
MQYYWLQLLSREPAGWYILRRLYALILLLEQVLLEQVLLEQVLLEQVLLEQAWRAALSSYH